MASSTTKNKGTSSRMPTIRPSNEARVNITVRPNYSKSIDEDSLGNLGISIDRGFQKGEEYSFAQQQAPVLENKFLNENTQVLVERLGNNEYSIPTDKFPVVEGERFYQSDQTDFSYLPETLSFKDETQQLTTQIFQNKNINKIKYVK